MSIYKYEVYYYCECLASKKYLTRYINGKAYNQVKIMSQIDNIILPSTCKLVHIENY